MNYEEYFLNVNIQRLLSLAIFLSNYEYAIDNYMLFNFLAKSMLRY